MLMTSAIPNLINGVSQQPFNLRLSSQAEEQKNLLSSVVDGLSHRPGTRSIAKLSTDTETWMSSFVHIINRDRTERYVVAVSDGDLKVFDINTGEEQVVNFPSGKTYLSSDNPPEGFRAVTVADYTILVNRMIKTAMSEDRTPEDANEALIYIRGGNYGRTYSVKIDDNLTVTHDTPSGSDADNHPAEIDTSTIASNLSSKLASELPSEFTVTRTNDVIRVSRSTNTPFSISTGDGAGGNNIKAFYQTTQRFSELPSVATSGFTIEIAGDNNSGFGNYFVRFETRGNQAGEGVWVETTKAEEPYRFDETTMPHALRREVDGTFTFSPLDWSDREVGDEESIPEPSCIGRAINDVFFYQNRLGFIADENVIMSRNAEFFNFWRNTATILTDADPIDVAVSHTRVSILNHAVPFNESLLLFSDQTQFIMESGDILTPTTVSVQQATEFESNSTTRPVGVGEFVYFPVNRGSFTGVREFFVDGTTAAKSANDVTSHCPRYIPSGVYKLAPSTSEDMICVLSETERSKMWVYKYYTNNQEKLQSSWSVWEFSPECSILNAEFIESTLVMLIAYPDGVYLEVIDVESGAADEHSSFLYRMDRKVYEDELGVEFDGNNTTISLPYEEPADIWVITRPHPEQEHNAGVVLNYERISPTEVQVVGDWTDTPIMAGRRIKSEYTFSTLTLRTGEEGGGQSSISEGRLQILYLALEYNNAGYFEIQTEAQGRSDTVRTFSGVTLSSGTEPLGDAALSTGRFKVPIFSRNTQVKIKLVTDSFLPAYFMSAEWEGRYTTRARRV